MAIGAPEPAESGVAGEERVARGWSSKADGAARRGRRWRRQRAERRRRREECAGKKARAVLDYIGRRCDPRCRARRPDPRRRLFFAT